jgi:hypothetical protein
MLRRYLLSKRMRIKTHLTYTLLVSPAHAGLEIRNWKYGNMEI